MSPEEKRLAIRLRAIAASRNWILARQSNPNQELDIDRDLWIHLVDTFERFFLSHEPELKSIVVELRYDY